MVQNGTKMWNRRELIKRAPPLEISLTQIPREHRLFNQPVYL